MISASSLSTTRSHSGEFVFSRKRISSNCLPDREPVEPTTLELDNGVTEKGIDRDEGPVSFGETRSFISPFTGASERRTGSFPASPHAPDSGFPFRCISKKNDRASAACSIAGASGSSTSAFR